MFRFGKSRRQIDGRQRVMMMVAGMVQFALLAAAQVDLFRRPASAVRGSKWAWHAATLINFVGPLAYFFFGRRRAGGQELRTAGA